MKKTYFTNVPLNNQLRNILPLFIRVIGKPFQIAALVLILIFSNSVVMAQTTTYQTIPAGSFIINMGVTPQTIGNGLRPYGLVYALLDQQVPVHWVINPDKVKDGIDFSHAGVDYRGGPFIVKAQHRTPAVDALISSWQGQGVVGTTNTSPIDNVPVHITFTSAPNWTMDQKNGKIAQNYFDNAGIPASAYGGANSSLWKDPVELDCCDDIFVMPHADPIWSSHQRLVSWNQECKGAIWSACHAPSALENMVDNITPNRDVQANFLTIKDPDWKGSSGVWTQSNSLILWGDHKDGSPPYNFNNRTEHNGQPYNYAADPVAQYMGSIDAATTNGSEQIFIPRQGIVSNPKIFNEDAVAGWRPETKILVYDPTQQDVTNPDLDELTNIAAVMVYGRGFGDDNRGLVMYEAGHSHAKGSGPANVAAQRAFFNFGFLSLWEKTIIPKFQSPPDIIYADEADVSLGYELSFQTGDPFVGDIESALWSSSCGGTFNTTASNPTLYTPPAIQGDTPCSFTVLITDECGRKSFDTHVATLKCRFDVTTTIVNPCFENPTGGSITMTPQFGVPGYAWSYTKDGGAPETGTGLSITDLTPGTYVVTVTDRDGDGCPKTFTVVLQTSPEIIISATPLHVSCPGGSNGAVNVTVSGGTPPFTYVWTKTGNGFAATTQNISGLTAGEYNLTVTDSRDCSNSTSVTVNQPTLIVITPTIEPVQCFDLNNGEISIEVNGGTQPYSFLWSDGSTSQNRINLPPDTYSVTVTDANNCTQTLSGLVITQPDEALSLSETHVNVLCFGGNNGSIDLTVSGGTPFASGDPYTYAWTKTGSSYTASTEDISGLTAGTYNVTVTDARNCTANLSVTITQPPAISLSVQKTDPSCPPDADEEELQSDGSITLTVTGGTEDYTYEWTPSNGGVIPEGQENQQNLTNLVAGTYTVVVTDENDCTATTTVTLVEQSPNPAQPTVINPQ